ncbi:hypothetical protein Dimus_009196 [Dionaea muscipula]
MSRSMEPSKEHRSNLNHWKPPVAPCIRGGTKLRDMFMADKGTLSYADFHHEITRNVEASAPEALGKQQQRGTDCKAAKEEELVKYMSQVPSYLEKGKNFQDKPLNVGVLDWGRLEKWQCSNKLMSPKHNGCSSASSSTSFFSTDVSSPLSSGGRSHSPTCKRMNSRPEVSPVLNRSQDIKTHFAEGPVSSSSHQRTGHFFPQPHQTKAYPWEFNCQNANKLEGVCQKIQEPSASICSSDGNLQRRLSGPNQASGKIRTLEKSERRQYDALGCSEVERPKTGTRLGKTNLNASDQECSERHKTVVLLLPRVSAETCCSVAQLPNVSKVNCEMLSKIQGSCFSETNNHDKTSCSDSFDTSKTCSLSSQAGGKGCGKTKGSCCPNGQQGLKVSSRSLPGMPNRAKVSTCRSGIENTDGKKPISPLKSRGEVLLSVDLDARTASGSESVAKSRNPSPIRRFGHGMSRIIKGAGSKDNSPQRRSISRDISSKPAVERATSAVSLDNSGVNKLHANNRARSSPLKRLLDPLLKPKGSHCVYPTEQFKNDSMLSAGPCKQPSNEQVLPQDLESAKLRSKLTSTCRNGAQNHQNLKHGSSSSKALLRLAVKNGLPLFTFAVDNSSDILAATLNKSSAPGKEPSSWIFTFFTVSEIKRKQHGLWSNQGPKKNDDGYVPNVVAHMKASNQWLSSSYHGGQKSINSDDLREYALLAVDVGQVDQHESSELLSTKELAAVVVKLPKTARYNASRDELLPSSRHVDLSVNPFSASPNAGLSATVILPGDVHTVPSKGAVSTLIQRWKSGGLCDCGGWDLGCQLKVYSNHNKLENKTTLNHTRHGVDGFKLFSQVGQENDFPVFNLVPLKDWLYSVEFDSSLSLLQTFAISIAVLECCRPSGFLESQIPRDVDVPEMIQMKASSQSQGQAPAPAPARYLSYPPLSPVGRV